MDIRIHIIKIWLHLQTVEIGLILVGFTTNGKAQIDIAVNPEPTKPIRKNIKKRMAVISEHNGRIGSINTGGVNRRKIMTVYKEQSLTIARILAENGELSAREIRKFCGYETSSILRMNYYKLFEKIGAKGHCTYRITDIGLKMLDEYKDLIE